MTTPEQKWKEINAGRQQLAYTLADEAGRVADEACRIVADTDDPHDAHDRWEAAMTCAQVARASADLIQKMACDGLPSDPYERALKAADRASKAAKSAREAYEHLSCNADSISAQHEEAARQHPEIMGAPEPQTPYEHGPKPASTDEKRLVWLRALYLIKQADPGSGLITRMAGHGIVPLEVLHDADVVFGGGFKTPCPVPPGAIPFDDPGIPF